MTIFSLNYIRNFQLLFLDTFRSISDIVQDLKTKVLVFVNAYYHIISVTNANRQSDQRLISHFQTMIKTKIEYQISMKKK